MENFIVTFARGFGTGGKEIASMLAKDLGIHCYENRILTLASQMSGLDEKLFLDINERIRNNGGFTGFLKGLPRSRQYIARNEKFVSDDRLFEYQSQIIRNLADQESCVIVGRCADYALSDNPDCINIFIHADLDVRIKNVSRNLNITENKARDIINKTDKQRASYYNYYTSKKWGDSKSYNLSLDAGKLGTDNCVEMILKFRELMDAMK